MKHSFASTDSIVQHPQWSNLSRDATAHTIATLLQGQQLPSKIWLVVQHEEDTAEWMEILQFWCNQQIPILHYPSDDPDTLNGLSPARTIPQRRLLTLQHWYSSEPCIVLSSVFGILHMNISAADLRESMLELEVHKEYAPLQLSEQLQQMGYLPSRELDAPGMFRLTGDNIHIWCVGHAESVRLSFFDTELEHIHRFVDGIRQEEKTLSIVPAR